MGNFNKDFFDKYSNVLDAFNDYNHKTYTLKDLRNKRKLNEVCDFCIKNEILSKADISVSIDTFKELSKFSAIIALVSLASSLFFYIFFAVFLVCIFFCAVSCSKQFEIFTYPPMTLHKNILKDSDNQTPQKEVQVKKVPKDILKMENFLKDINKLLNKNISKPIYSELKNLCSIIESLKEKTQVNTDVEIPEINTLEIIINELQNLIEEYTKIKSVDSLADILEGKILGLIKNIEIVVENMGKNYIQAQVDNIDSQINGINMFTEKKKSELNNKDRHTLQI